MDLKIFFSPVDEHVFDDIHDPTSFFKNISIFSEKQPDYKGANIALIGILEDGGSDSNTGAAKAANEIRKKLYRLKKGYGQYKIVDLGNLRKGVDITE